MKKLVFLFVAFAAVSFASCGNKAANTEVSTETDSVAVVEEAAPVVDSAAVVADTVATDSVATAE
ncbi:hypothetical protein I6E18_11315 [Phocaeicola barnesiae]|jgi:hypothetical protein|uniref:Lipoprotein n=1 Tax=Phocaeicola barnesiae TaxID=376804 RepID=A0AAW5N775_9BACT|nr:hypothetical protein [Phocaeicola barnesiae]MBS6469200.1 hypothetical protein [Bacteroides sp.]CDD31793.1 putative uncharacterized protein [Bacteroides sp. CAG:714]MCF2576737.1 hypothetical protein [Phocaeicola barnesiae]MCF2599427.1 hypothetical protein [Phocaeicola barnesiae]MCR8874675.1 hypothetical protein [Phocaeicola barnesiae]